MTDLPRHRAWVAAIAAAVLLCLPDATTTFAQAPQSDYERDVATCQDGRPDDQKAACLREAAAAQAERAKGVLGQDDKALVENARRRCDPLPPDQKADCLSRVGGLGSVEGSVREGAIIRETVTIQREIRGPAPVVPVVIEPQTR